MPRVTQLLSDPQFMGLDPVSQKSILAGIDPSFANISDSDFATFKNGVLHTDSQGGGVIPAVTSKAPIPNALQGAPAPPHHGFFDSAWSALKSYPSNLVNSLAPTEAVGDSLNRLTALYAEHPELKSTQPGFVGPPSVRQFVGSPMGSHSPTRNLSEVSLSAPFTSDYAPTFSEVAGNTAGNAVGNAGLMALTDAAGTAVPAMWNSETGQAIRTGVRTATPDVAKGIAKMTALPAAGYLAHTFGVPGQIAAEALSVPEAFALRSGAKQLAGGVNSGIDAYRDARYGPINGPEPIPKGYKPPKTAKLPPDTTIPSAGFTGTQDVTSRATPSVPVNVPTQPLSFAPTATPALPLAKPVPIQQSPLVASPEAMTPAVPVRTPQPVSFAPSATVPFPMAPKPQVSVPWSSVAGTGDTVARNTPTVPISVPQTVRFQTASTEPFPMAPRVSPIAGTLIPQGGSLMTATPTEQAIGPIGENAGLGGGQPLNPHAVADYTGPIGKNKIDIIEDYLRKNPAGKAGDVAYGDIVKNPDSLYSLSDAQKRQILNEAHAHGQKNKMAIEGAAKTKYASLIDDPRYGTDENGNPNIGSLTMLANRLKGLPDPTPRPSRPSIAVQPLPQ